MFNDFLKQTGLYVIAVIIHTFLWISSASTTIGVVLVILKITKLINISWFLVTLPLWWWFGIVILCLVVLILISTIKWIIQR